MRTINFSFTLSLLVIGLLTLSACSGGGGSSEVRNLPTTETLGVSGIVEDGPLREAKVHLKWTSTDAVAKVCGASGAGSCETVTDAHGMFFFKVRSDADLSALQIVTSGGLDAVTGVDFAELPLVAHLDLFRDNETQVAVTPITTLLAAETNRLADAFAAQASIRQILNLSSDQALTDWPSHSEALQKRAILLTKVAMERKRAGHTAPFEGLADVALFTGDGFIDPLAVSRMQLDTGAADRTLELSQALQGNALHDWGKTFQRVELRQALIENLVLMLDDGSAFDRQDPRFAENVDLLAGEILAAAQGDPIPLGNLVPQRIARFVLFSYGLNQPESFSAAAEEFLGSLSRVEATQSIALATDPEIRQLASLRTKYAIAVPLLESERLDSESKRIEYYFNSDASHLYQAETLVAGINDAELNDSIMFEVVQGQARVGLYDEAALIARSQIVQTEIRGRGYIEIARALTNRGLDSRAVDMLKIAEACFLQVIEAKGIAFIDNSDTFNLQSLAANYRKAGSIEQAQKALDYLDQAIPYLSTSSLFSRLVVGTWQIADEYLDADDLAAARPLVDDLYRYARMTPANESQGILYYKARVFNLVETAQRYARLGEQASALAIFRQIQDLRDNDGLGNFTRDETWAYVQDLVKLLYKFGEPATALGLAQTIPDSYTDYRGNIKSGKTYRLSALKSAAVIKALDEGIAAAEDFITAQFVDMHDQIEAWTHFATSQKRPYVALEAIKRGYFDLALAALDKAHALVARLTETSDRDRYRYQIEWGYAKLADLAREAQDADFARRLLIEAEELAWSLSDLEYQVSALVDIAEVYYTLADDVRAKDLLYATFEQIRGASATDKLGMQEMVLEVAQTLFPEPLAEYVAQARGLFTEGQTYPGTDHDDLARLEAEALIRAANRYAFFAGNDPIQLSAARNLLAEAQGVAEQIYVEKTRFELYVADKNSQPQIIDGYARAADYATAIDLARALPFRNERHLALQSLAKIYTSRDDLPDIDLATVDTDGDGLPNFFDPAADDFAIASSERSIDPDSDGDGIADHLDARPLYRDAVR